MRKMLLFSLLVCAVGCASVGQVGISEQRLVSKPNMLFFAKRRVRLSKLADRADRARFSDVRRRPSGRLHLLQIVAMRLLSYSFAILLGLFFSVAGSRATTTVVSPSFELNRFGSEELVKLDDFAGSIVILDFFAYWCVPCRKVSSETGGTCAEFLYGQRRQCWRLPGTGGLDEHRAGARCKKPGSTSSKPV